MKNIFSVVYLLSLVLTGAAQSQTKDSLVQKNVLLVSFDPKMYLSDIDRDVTVASNLTFRDLLSLYRSELMSNVSKGLTDLHYQVFYPKSKGEKDSVDDFVVTYRSISYSYEPLPTPKEKITNTVKGNSKKKENISTPPPSGIVNGQIVEAGIKAPKYMATVITNKKGFEYLTKHYSADYILVLNQLETRINTNGYSMMEAENLSRVLKVHYTIFDSKGERVCSNVAEQSFPTDMNNAAEIVKQNFPVIAGKINACLAEASKVITNKANH